MGWAFVSRLDAPAPSFHRMRSQAGNVAAWSRQARDQAEADRSPAVANTIGITDVSCFAAKTAAAACGDDINL
jgi:hypothetical protein